jgi:hypothetical protein
MIQICLKILKNSEKQMDYKTSFPDWFAEDTDESDSEIENVKQNNTKDVNHIDTKDVNHIDTKDVNHIDTKDVNHIDTKDVNHIDIKDDDKKEPTKTIYFQPIKKKHKIDDKSWRVFNRERDIKYIFDKLNTLHPSPCQSPKRQDENEKIREMQLLERVKHLPFKVY